MGGNNLRAALVCLCIRISGGLLWRPKSDRDTIILYGVSCVAPSTGFKMYLLKEAATFDLVQELSSRYDELVLIGIKGDGIDVKTKVDKNRIDKHIAILDIMYGIVSNGLSSTTF